ncbi:Universal stress protein [Rubripirellula tenax]|uniref:Universal stress protein n=1 Tax=Rubripirellula tenax TaxID=2528015 RepID=A0A5C6E910_9BACT|nr:universal stress protein [Rubripirellula tenax]TWU46143.1 Universal stress protein [Rubripirellula tenax]
MKKILIATDGSQSADDAVKFLSHLPHDETIELTVLTVLHVPGQGKAYLVGDWMESCLAQERMVASESFASVESAFAGANVRLSHVTREGHPGETIVAIANELQPDLLVVGATGRSAVARVLLGSISDYVATHAPCSVLIVRSTGALEKKRPLRVVICYQPTGPSQAAVEEFAEFDWGSKTEVDLVTVHSGQGFYQEPDADKSLQNARAAAEQLHNVAPRANGRVIDSEHFGESLVRFIEANDTDLVVLGETPRTRLSRILMGSMTRFVLRQAPCSVWITRNRMIHGTAKADSSKTGSVTA